MNADESKPENPPAFPQAEQLSQIIDQGQHRIQTPFIPANSGMTLRDYFAGQALMSMLNTPAAISDATFSKAAELSYKFADAMLKARQS